MVAQFMFLQVEMCGESSEVKRSQTPHFFAISSLRIFFGAGT